MLESASSSRKANAEGDKVDKKNQYPQVYDEHTQSNDQTKREHLEKTDATAEIVLHFSEVKTLEDEPTAKKPSSSGINMTLEEAEAQLTEIKRLANLKAKQDKNKEMLKQLSKAEVQAQALEFTRYEAKIKKMMDEYNHYMTFRADKFPITKINYRIHKVTKDATMKIERNNQLLSLTVYEKFVTKQLGLSEWIEVHALASKMKGKDYDTLLKSLRAKFDWLKTLARNLGLPPPSEILAFGQTPAEKKRKGTSDLIEQVFVKEDIRMDGMERNLIPPKGVTGSRGLVITEPEAGIFYYNGNFDLVFQRETELEFTIEAKDDAEEAKKIVKENLDDFGM
ncbi:hypothetical protein Tco_0368625 [Tanacetum coccineum]